VWLSGNHYFCLSHSLQSEKKKKTKNFLPVKVRREKVGEKGLGEGRLVTLVSSLCLSV
jgi:hypothetical protein